MGRCLLMIGSTREMAVLIELWTEHVASTSHVVIDLPYITPCRPNYSSDLPLSSFAIAVWECATTGFERQHHAWAAVNAGLKQQWNSTNANVDVDRRTGIAVIRDRHKTGSFTRRTWPNKAKHKFSSPHYFKKELLGSLTFLLHS